MALLRFFSGPIIAGLLVGMLALWWYEWSPNSASSLRAGPVTSYATAVNRAAPSVVNIYTTQIVSRTEEMAQAPMFDRFMEEPRRERALSSLGSGVIVTNDGHLLTSYHIIQDADEILVSFRDGRDAPATVVGSDPETDLALLKVDLPNLPQINLNYDRAVQVGDVVLAIGNPLGVGQTVSMGIVSATGRSHLGIATFENFIQTDAAINRGNSGGALINTEGRLVGINTAILSDDGSWQGIGFATPAQVAKDVMRDLIDHGRVIRGFLGVTVQDMTSRLAESFGLDSARGGIVTQVVRDGPAYVGGLRPGDVLVGINGDAVADGYQAMNRIAGMRPDTEVTLHIIRNQQSITLNAIIGTRPSANDA